MNLKRIIASTIIRRLTLLALAAVLAWLGLGGEARAQTAGTCDAFGPTWPTCTQPQAYSDCVRWRDEALGSPTSGGTRNLVRADCVHGPVGGSFGFSASVCRSTDGETCRGGTIANYTTAYATGCPAGQVWNDLPGFKKCMPSCTGRGTPSFTPPRGTIIPNGSIGCSNGCQYAAFSNDDGTYSRNFLGDSPINHCSTLPDCTANTGYTMNFGLSMCVPPMPECQPNEIKDPVTGACGPGCPAGMTTDATGACVPESDNCPAGQIRSPSGSCLPGEGQCAAGEVRKPDGTCGRDADNDGEADELGEGEKPSFSGGDSCDAPPACNGDAIMCGQARIQWRIDCNTRHDIKVSGGTCGAVPICAGKNCNALEYSQLLQQWRTSCLLEQLVDGSAGGGNGEAGQPGWTKVDGMNQDPGQGVGDGDTPTLHSTDVDGEGIDQSPIVGGGGSCPSLGASGTGALVNNLVAMVNSPGAAWCSYIAAVYSILVLFGMATSILIMAKGW